MATSKGTRKADKPEWLMLANSVATPKVASEAVIDTLIRATSLAIEASAASKIYPILEAKLWNGFEGLATRRFPAKREHVLQLQFALLTCNQLTTKQANDLRSKDAVSLAMFGKAPLSEAAAGISIQLRATKDPATKANLLRQLCHVFLHIGKVEEAVETGIKAVAVAKLVPEDKNWWAEVGATASLAYAYFCSMQFKKAEKLFKLAEKLHAKLTKKTQREGVPSEPVLHVLAGAMYCQFLLIARNNPKEVLRRVALTKPVAQGPFNLGFELLNEVMAQAMLTPVDEDQIGDQLYNAIAKFAESGRTDIMCFVHAVNATIRKQLKMSGVESAETEKSAAGAKRGSSKSAMINLLHYWSFVT